MVVSRNDNLKQGKISTKDQNEENREQILNGDGGEEDGKRIKTQRGRAMLKEIARRNQEETEKETENPSRIIIDLSLVMERMKKTKERRHLNKIDEGSTTKEDRKNWMRPLGT